MFRMCKIKSSTTISVVKIVDSLRTNHHSTTSSIPDTAVYTKPSTAVPELRSGFQWKQDASAARDLAKAGQGYLDPVERQYSSSVLPRYRVYTEVIVKNAMDAHAKT